MNLAVALNVMSKLPKDVLVVLVNAKTGKHLPQEFVNRVRDNYPLYFENSKVITDLQELNNLSNAYQLAA